MSGRPVAAGLERAHGAALALLIAEAGRTFAASLDLDETIHSIGNLVVGWFADWCVVAIRSGNGPFERVYVAAADDRDAGTAELLERFILETERRSLITDVLRAPEPVLVPSVAAAHRAGVARNGEHDLMRRLELTSYLAVPLVAGKHNVGGLLIASRSGELTRAELRVSEEIAALAAIAIDNAGKYEGARAALDSRDSRLTVVAHDLRNPLANITFAAGLLRLRLREAGLEGLDGMITIILESAGYMGRLVGDLTDVANLESGRLSIKPERLAAEAIVVAAADAFRARAEQQGIGLTVDVAAGVADVAADATRVRQVMSNLIGNALKFTAAGGTVHIRAEPAPGHVHFAVIDSGRGIAPDVIDRIFDPFWCRDDRHDRGLGLGLSISRSIIELHRGRIWAVSTPGVGTELHFTLPAADGEPAPDAGQPIDG